MFHVPSLIDALASVDAEQQLAARPGLPRRLLRNSRRINPVLSTLQARLDELDARLDPEGLDPVVWSNPEIYAPIVSLGDRCPDEAAASRLLDRLDVLTGRVDVSAESIEDGVYRLTRLGQGVVERRGGQVVMLDAHRGSAEGGEVYLPVPQLFADLPFPPVYGESTEAGDFAQALARLGRARGLLADVDPAVAADFDRTVGTVALLPPVPLEEGQPLPQAHWSFNLRLRLPGVIFVNPFSVGVPGLAEGLLHEYLHQRMWLWWELCPPAGLPAWGPGLRSPVSGQMRPLITMLQALVIFRCVMQLHEGLLQRADLDAEERAYCRGRVELLRNKVPELARELEERLPVGSEARRMVELVREDFEAGSAHAA